MMKVLGSHSPLPQGFYHLRIRDRKAWLYHCETLPRNEGFLGHPNFLLADRKLGTDLKILAELTGLEPAVSCVTGRHFHHLNYSSVSC